MLALDIGGSHASCALACDRQLVAQRTINVDNPNFLHMLPALENLVQEVVRSSGVPIDQCSGLVIGFPGIVDSNSGQSVGAHVVRSVEKWTQAGLR